MSNRPRPGFWMRSLLPMPPFEDKGMAFFDWVDNIYDPDEVTRNFQAKGWAVRLTDSILHRE